MLTRTEVLTFPVQVSHYFGQQQTFWAKIGAMSFLGALPVFPDRGDGAEAPGPRHVDGGGEGLTMTDLKAGGRPQVLRRVSTRLRGVDLAIEEGEFAVFVGPSGCGKSTLLRMIAGLETVDDGDVLIGGTVGQFPAPARPQRCHGVPELRPLTPICRSTTTSPSGCGRARCRRRRSDRRVRQAAEMLGITAQLQRRPRQLSGGQRQAGGDRPRDRARCRPVSCSTNRCLTWTPSCATKCGSRSKRLHQEIGKTTVYVTHDQIEAMTLADRIVLLRDGVIEQQGAPLDLFERPVSKFVAGFLVPPLAADELRPRHAGGGRRPAGRPLCRRHHPALSGRSAPAAGTTMSGAPWNSASGPEYLTRPAAAERRPGQEPLSVTIDLVQPTGTRVHVQFRLGGTEVTAELAAHDVERPGAHIELLADMSRAILIDPESERVL